MSSAACQDRIGPPELRSSDLEECLLNSETTTTTTIESSPVSVVNGIGKTSTTTTKKKNKANGQLNGGCDTVTASDKIESGERVDVSVNGASDKSEKEELVLNGHSNGAVVGNGALKPILSKTSAAKSAFLDSVTSPTTPTNSPTKKNVTFTDVEQHAQKFLNGEPIVDKQNPFKAGVNGFIVNGSDNSDDDKYIIKKVQNKSNGAVQRHISFDVPDGLEEDDDDNITTEDVLKQSKYVKTYVKNPDKYLTFDRTVIEQLKLEDNIKPVLKSKKLSKSTKERLKELKFKYSPQSFYNNQNHNKTNSPPKKHYLKGDQSKYPDLSDIKVKVGTDLEDSLYNPDEVAENVKKFDNRFKQIAFGSQDDIDEIAEKTDAEVETGDEETDSPDAAPKTAEEKKSLTNTVNSNEFKEYLKKKGLTLIPVAEKETPKAKPVPIPRSIATRSAEIMDDRNNPRKKSVFQRLFNTAIFSNRGKTIPTSNAPKPLQTPEARRVILEESPQRQSNIPISARSSLKKKQNIPVEDFIDMNMASSSQRHALPKPVARKTVPSSVQQENPIYGNIDLTKSRLYQSRVKANNVPQTAETPRSTRIPIHFSNSQEPNLTRNRNYQSLIVRRTNAPENVYGNIQRRGSIDNKKVESPVLANVSVDSSLFQKVTPSSSNDRIINGPQFTSTPNEKESNLSPLPAQVAVPQSQMVNQIDQKTWNQLKQLKDMTEVSLQRVKAAHAAQTENIYESTEKMVQLRNAPPNQMNQRRLSIPNPYVNVRIQDEPNQNMRMTPQRQIITNPNIPSRSQSVMDKRIQPNLVYGYADRNRSNSASQTPIAFRKQESLSREDILGKLREFCEKSKRSSISKLSITDQQQQKQEISPVSYASVQTLDRMPVRVAQPQVPARNFNSPQPFPNNGTINNQLLQHKPPRHQTQTPIIYSTVQKSSDPNRRSINSGVYQFQMPDGVYATPQHIPRRNTMQSQPTPGAYYGQPNMTVVRKTRDGRSTPLVLQRVINHHPQLQQQQQAMPMTPVYNFRPIPESTNHRQQYPIYESDGGEEIGRILRNNRIQHEIRYEEDWQNEKGPGGGRNQQQPDQEERRRGGRGREDPRRHTLGADMMYGPPGQGHGPQRTMDLEMGTRSQKNKKGQPVRGYVPVNQGPLFDDDPGIMSEVETASTGFRRGGKQRSSLPVVRTPSKTLERPLGLVFLQYRSETKRALLPNEITSIDTVRALFVRSFPRQLTMAYLEGPNVKIYIHDASKDMFYELEDVRSHLREIRDRSVLRLFESNEVAAPQVLPGGPGIPQPLPPPVPGHWEQDQSYFSEPEFDTEFQHQHIHKNKIGGKGPPYYVGSAQTLPRGMYSDRNKNNMVGAPVKPIRSYGSRGSLTTSPFPYPSDQLYSIPDGYMSSPERGTRGGYEEPYYSQYGTRGNNVTPIIDEEQGDSSLSEDQYALYGGSLKMPSRSLRNPSQLYDPSRPEDLHRIRVEHMERQLANLTGLVQKALIHNPQMGSGGGGGGGGPGTLNQNYLGVPGGGGGPGSTGGGSLRSVLDEMEDGFSAASLTSIQANGTMDDIYIRDKPPKLGKSACHKSVSFEKSVSFSDDIQDGTPKSHSPQHPADSKPPKPAIKSSTLPRMSSQERDRIKPSGGMGGGGGGGPPGGKQMVNSHANYRPDLALAPEVYNHLRGLQKKAKDLRTEVRTLRRLSQAQAIAVREDIKDTFMRIRATLLANSETYWGHDDQDKQRLSRDEELYKQEVIRLEKDLSDLEASVEGLRGEVINRRTRVNMAAVEDMALVLSRASKTVAELKMKFPSLQNSLRNILASEMDKMVREEKFLKDEPDRLESALRRCKKLTGTLVTLKRLASVQEQRTSVEPTGAASEQEQSPRVSAEVQTTNKPVPSPRLGTVSIGGVTPENALDALLDELQTFAKPPMGVNEIRPDDSTSDDSSQTLQNTSNSVANHQLNPSSLYPSDAAPYNSHGLKRLHSYPSGSDTDTSPPQPLRPVGKPPVPERSTELMSKVNNKRIPPPPPPRTSSRSPLASPTSPNLPMRLQAVTEQAAHIDAQLQMEQTSSSDSVNSQDHMQRQIALELRHQELLKKQKMLQEQYARLQQMSKNSALPPNSGVYNSSDLLALKKTGSESNLPTKMGLQMALSGGGQQSGSMKNLLLENQGEEQQFLHHNMNNNLNSMNHNNQVNNNGIINTNSTSNSTTTTTNKVYETEIL